MFSQSPYFMALQAFVVVDSFNCIGVFNVILLLVYISYLEGGRNNDRKISF